MYHTISTIELNNTWFLTLTIMQLYTFNIMHNYICMHIQMQLMNVLYTYIPLILVKILGLCLYLYTNMKYTGIAGRMRPTAIAASTGSPITGTNTRNIATNTITTGRGRITYVQV